MIEARFGAAKMPIPLPTRIRGTASSGYETLAPRFASNKNPRHETTRPEVARNLAPYRSESHPLTGPKNAIEAEFGMRKRPAVWRRALDVGPSPAT